MKNPLISGIAWVKRHRHRIGLIAVGHTAKRIEEYLFDWLIYGIVVLWATSRWGAWHGSFVAFGIMAPISALFCWFYIIFYDWAKKDWFGFELLKELKEEERSGRGGRLLQKILKLGDIPAFFALSIYQDPFMTTVYLRKKGHGHAGLSRRDWNFFWSSVFVSNAYWTLRWIVIIELVRLLWAVSLHAL
jgi:hypothetical protein